MVDHKKTDDDLISPQTPYFLFCSKQREELRKKGNDKKLTAKELGNKWTKLTETKKRFFWPISRRKEKIW